MFNSISEAVQSAIAGNNDAFTYLYDRTYKNKYYVALKYMKNEDAAADVLQDAYMRAFQNLNMLRDYSRFDSWLGMIVANTAKNYLKKKNPVLFSEMDHDNCEGEVVEYQELLVEDRRDFNPEEYYSKQEASMLVDELLSTLPPEQKICMIMFYLEGQSVDEIAAALECNKNTVLSRINYGRKKIRAKGEELEKKGYRLYSVSPVVLLMLLLSYEKKNYVIGSAVTAAGAAKRSFIGTTAGKVLAAFVGIAIAGGITVGIVLGIRSSGNDNKDKITTEYHVNNSEYTEKTELTTEATVTADVTGNTEEVEKVTEAATEADPTEEAADILRTYLTEELVPKYKVYDPSQTYIQHAPDGYPTICSFVYDKEKHDLIRTETDGTEKEAFLKEYTYDYSGIYYADINDFNNDGMPELLIIRGTGVHQVESVGYEANIFMAALYRVEDGKAVQAYETPVYFGENGMDGTEKYNISRLYIMEKDKEYYLTAVYWKPHSDVSQHDYALNISLSDLSYASYLHGTIIDNPGGSMYSLYKDVSFADGTSAEYKAEYHEVNGKWVSEPGFGYASEEYLAERGYMNDSSEKIFEICMVTDVARKYIFDDETEIGESSLSGGNSDTGSEESSINETGGDDTGSEEVFEELYDRPIGYHGGNRYEYRGIVINSDESCTFTRSDHEPYAGDLEGEANAKISELRKINDHTYGFTVSEAKDAYTAHTEEVEVEDPAVVGGTYTYRHEFIELASDVEGEYTVYLPGTPVSELPANVQIGGSLAQEGETKYYYDENTNKTVMYIIYKNGSDFAYCDRY